MKTKCIILCILLACAIGISIPLYSIYMRGTLTEQKAYAIGKKVLTETTMHDYSIMEIRDSGFVWRVHALCKYSGAHPFEQDYFVEISKRTGKVEKVGWDYMFEEDYE
ncbi:MAG: hypothetical protein IJD83_06040 [Clostridia bacterium]|nr:hypothetical protein [Clostridia bacterium]